MTDGLLVGKKFKRYEFGEVMLSLRPDRGLGSEFVGSRASMRLPSGGLLPFAERNVLWRGFQGSPSAVPALSQCGLGV